MNNPVHEVVDIYIAWYGTLWLWLTTVSETKWQHTSQDISVIFQAHQRASWIPLQQLLMSQSEAQTLTVFLYCHFGNIDNFHVPG